VAVGSASTSTSSSAGPSRMGSPRKETKEVRFDIKGEEARAGKMD
jgi:hypothetical protein